MDITYKDLCQLLEIIKANNAEHFHQWVSLQKLKHLNVCFQVTRWCGRTMAKKKVRYTPLIYAAKSGANAIIKAIVERGGVNWSYKNQARVATKLCQQDSNLYGEFIIFQDFRRFQGIALAPKGHCGDMFMLAVARNDLTLIRLIAIAVPLLEVYHPDGCYLSALYILALHGKFSSIEELEGERIMEQQLNHASYAFGTPLQAAVRADNVRTTQVLLEMKADPNLVRSRDKEAPLHGAAKYGYRHIASALLSVKACCNQRTKKGLSPVELAKEAGMYGVVQLLLTSKASVDARPQKRISPAAAVGIGLVAPVPGANASSIGGGGAKRARKATLDKGEHVIKGLAYNL